MPFLFFFAFVVIILLYTYIYQGNNYQKGFSFLQQIDHELEVELSTFGTNDDFLLNKILTSTVYETDLDRPILLDSKFYSGVESPLPKGFFSAGNIDTLKFREKSSDENTACKRLSAQGRPQNNVNSRPLTDYRTRSDFRSPAAMIEEFSAQRFQSGQVLEEHARYYLIIHILFLTQFI